MSTCTPGSRSAEMPDRGSALWEPVQCFRCLSDYPGMQHSCSVSSAPHNSRPAERMTILRMSEPVLDIRPQPIRHKRRTSRDG